MEHLPGNILFAYARRSLTRYNMFNLDKKASSDLNLAKSSRQIEYPLFGSIGTKYSRKEEIHLLEP